MKQLINRLRAAGKIKPTYIILLFILVFFGKNILPTNRIFIGGDDITQYFYWHAEFVKEQLLAGRLPLWNPYYYCGHPFQANPETFVSYPATLLFLALPLPWAFNLDTLLHIYLAAMGIYCFVFLITKSKSGGLAAAVVYSLSGYFMDNIFAGHLPMVHTAALLPWVFYFIEKGYKTERRIFFIISGLVLGLQILSGNPQNNLYTAIFLTLYCFIRYLLTPQPLRVKSFYRFGMYFLLIPLVALGISAIQVLPSLEFMSLSDRADNAFEFATYYSFPPENFLTFLVPQPAYDRGIGTGWEWTGYFGILAIVLAGIGVLLSKHHRHALCMNVMLFFAITFMVGSQTPFYWFYYKWIPGVSAFRIPARCIVILVFSMAVLAGLGVQHLCESPPTRKRHTVVMIGLAVLLLCLFGVGKLLLVPLGSEEMRLPTAFAIAAFIVLNATPFIKNRHLIAALLIAVLFTDLYLTYSSETPRLSQEELLQQDNYELILGQDPGFSRFNTPYLQHRGIKFHYYCANAYTPIVLDHYYKFVHSMADLRIPRKLRHTLNPQLFTEDLVFSSKVLGIKYAVVKRDSRLEFIVNQDKVMPRAVLVSNATVLRDLEEHIQYLKKPDFDPEKQVLLQSAPYGHTLPPSKNNDGSTKSGVVGITEYHPNRIKLKSFSAHNTYLVLSELFYPGWHAYVDDKEVPILRANFLLRAIPLAPGQHQIVFVYKPASFFTGAAISLSAVLVLVCIYLHYRKKFVRDSASP